MRLPGLEAESLTEEQFQSLMSFAARVAENLEAIDSFGTMRQIIEELDVWATPAVENGQKVVYVLCYLGEKELCLLSSTTKQAEIKNGRASALPFELGSKGPDFGPSPTTGLVHPAPGRPAGR